MKATNNFSLEEFKRSFRSIIATSETAYDGEWSSRRSRQKLKDYSNEEIEQIINSSDIISQQKLSRNYFYKDGFYRRIILYYATLLRYYGILIPNPSFGQKLSTEHIKKRYSKAMDYVDKMSLENLLTNCSFRALVDGSYYGIVQESSKNIFSVLDLPSGFCVSRFKDEKGNDLIEFDLTYFNTILDKKHRDNALKVYPKIFLTEYRKYTNGKRKSKWLLIPSDIGICFKFFDGRPLFINVIPATIQYDEAVGIERERDLEEIRKIVVQKVPHNSANEFLLEPDEVEVLHNGAVEMLKSNRNISVLTTYADVDSIQSKTSADTASNNIEKMVQHIYNESGTSSQLFASNSNLAIEYSLKNDLSLMMILGNKYSKFITNIINDIFANTNINFTYKILPVSYYNEDKFIDTTLKLANSGYSFLLPAIASGLSQKELTSVKDLENDVLDLGIKLIPLSTAYTQSGSPNSGQVGAPKKPLEEKAPKTIKNEESIDRQGGSGNATGT